MINFNDLRITPDGKHLIIDAEIAPYSYYDGMYISQIIIDTEETFSISGPSSKPFYTTAFQDQEKEQSLDITAESLSIESFTGHIYYVYVVIDGIPESQTPCGWDNRYTIGVTLDWRPIYNIGIKSMSKTVNNCCSIDKQFIDYILRLESFILALRTGQYVMANDIFNMLYKEATSPEYVASICNCG